MNEDAKFVKKYDTKINYSAKYISETYHNEHLIENLSVKDVKNMLKDIIDLYNIYIQSKTRENGLNYIKKYEELRKLEYWDLTGVKGYNFDKMKKCILK
jgi:5'(3')-deoxyribonucleotidase